MRILILSHKMLLALLMLTVIAFNKISGEMHQRLRPKIIRNRTSSNKPKSISISGGASALSSRVITSQQYQIMKLLSGGVAGTFAACVTNPIELIKSQLQSSNAQSGDLSFAKGSPLKIANAILKSEGLAGLFRGLPPTLVGIIPSRSCYFYAYSVGHIDSKTLHRVICAHSLYLTICRPLKRQLLLIWVTVLLQTQSSLDLLQDGLEIQLQIQFGW